MSRRRRSVSDAVSYPDPQGSSLTDLGADALVAPVRAVVTVQVRLRTLLAQAIDDGLQTGLRRAYKYDDAPRGVGDWDARARDGIANEIWLAIDDVCDISDEPCA